jgi:hypothetical protein
MMGAVVFLARWWRVAVMVALCATIVALWLANGSQQRKLDDAAQALAAERAAHGRTVDGYARAAAIAAQREAEAVARVQAQQAAITERIGHDYQVRLADSDARYQRLREQAASYSGGVVDQDMSAAGEAACRAYANAACDELPALLKAAQDNTDQLLALIAWATAQADVGVEEVGE